METEELSIKKQLRHLLRERADLDLAQERHLTIPEIHSLVSNVGSEDECARFRDHISRCARCFREFKEMREAQKDTRLFDVAMPRKAAAGIGDILKVTAEGGRYLIIIRRFLAERNRGVITVQALEPLSQDLKGKVLIVKDGSGRILVRGGIANGEISRKLESIDDIDDTNFAIYAV